MNADVDEQRPFRLPFWLALGANAANFLLTTQFYLLPQGASIRPMAWARWVIYIAIAGFIAIFLVLPVIRRHRRSLWPWMTIVLAITPFPLASAMLHHAAGGRGLFLAP